MLACLHGLATERGGEDVSLPVEGERGDVFPWSCRGEVDRDCTEAPGLDLHHTVYRPEGGAVGGLQGDHSVSSAPVLYLHLRVTIISNVNG